MRLGIEKVAALDFARFIDQDAQGFAGAVQTIAQQSRKGGVHGVMLDAFCALRSTPSWEWVRMARRNRLPELRQLAKPAGYEYTERMLH